MMFLRVMSSCLLVMQQRVISTRGSYFLAMEFNDIMIDDQLYGIATTGLQARSRNAAAPNPRRSG